MRTATTMHLFCFLFYGEGLAMDVTSDMHSVYTIYTVTLHLAPRGWMLGSRSISWSRRCYITPRDFRAVYARSDLDTFIGGGSAPRLTSSPLRASLLHDNHMEPSRLDEKNAFLLNFSFIIHRFCSNIAGSKVRLHGLAGQLALPFDETLRLLN